METLIYGQLKKKIRVGAATSTGNRRETASLPNFRSIFTIETYAIHIALMTIPETK